MIVTAGKTNVSVYVYFVDDDGGTAPGEPTTGLLFSDIETGGSASYCRQGAARTDFTLITLASASATHADGGFILVDDTNMKGLYRLDVPDAAFATAVDQVTIQLVAASGKNTVMRPVVVDITDVDLREANGRVLLRAATETQIDDILIDTAAVVAKLPSGTIADLIATDVVTAGAIITSSGAVTTVTNLTNLPAITANWLTAAGMNADASIEIRDAITGGAYALDTDANGRLRIVDGVGAGEFDTLSGTVLLRAATETQIDDILIDTAVIGALGAGLTNIPWNSSWDAEVQSECDDAIRAIDLHLLINTALPTNWATDITANSALDYLADDGTAVYDRTTDSLQAIRDRGDASWITGGGGGITDMLNVVPLIPKSIDVANTAVWRIGLMLTNALDDLPSTAEITPGTISIDRKAIGATSWSSIITDGAMSEIGGLIYYDEVFNAATGYVAGDSIRLLFKNQKVTVAANDYEVTGSVGRVMYTSIREAERGTDGANTTTPLTAAGVRSALGMASADLDTQLDALPTQAEITGGGYALDTDALGRVRIVDGVGAGELDTVSGLVQLLAATQASIDDIEADTNELQADWTNAGRLDAILDIIAADTTTDIPALIATAQEDLDKLTGTDGATLATAQANYAPATVAALATTDAVVDSILVLLDDARGEPGQGAPPVNPDLATKVDYLYKAWRNKKVQTATELRIYADDTTTIDHKATISEVASIFTQEEFVTGA